MSTLREKRLRKIEDCLGMNELPVPVFFIDSPRFRDEPDDLIIGASANGGIVNWKRNGNESVEEFLERVRQDIENTDGNLYMFCLERDHSGLPENSNEFPAFTPYSEVINRIKKNGFVNESNGKEIFKS